MNLVEFKNWALAQGIVGNPTAANSYRGECVSLIQQYLYKVYGNKFRPYGNAKDWINYYPSNFKKIALNSTVSKGDIVVYDGKFGGGYGHIVLIDAEGKVLEQNGEIKDRVTEKNKLRAGYGAILRYKGEVPLGAAENTKVPIAEDKKIAKIKELQELLKTVQDGFYGPVTKELVNKRRIMIGAINSDLVRFTQILLKDKGYDLVIDGDFGDQTFNIVKQYQKDNKQVIDGWVGAQTMESLLK